MKSFIKNIGIKGLKWTVENPRKFYVGAMIFLSVSFAGSLIHGIFFPEEPAFRIKTPILYSESSVLKQAAGNHDEEMEKIVSELKRLKLKLDRHELQKHDSLRIEYLYNQYQGLKNGY